MQVGTTPVPVATLTALLTIVGYALLDKLVLPKLNRHRADELPLLRASPQIKAGDLSPADWESRIEGTVRKVLSDKLGPILERQTEILEHMDERQEQMEQTLGDNTTALQLFIKLQEQRQQIEDRRIT